MRVPLSARPLLTAAALSLVILNVLPALAERTQPIMKLDTTEDVRAFLAAVDSGDQAALAAAFADDIVLTFGNADPVRGETDVLSTFAGTSDAFVSIRHDLKGVWRGAWEGGEVRSAECEATYTRHDGTAVTLAVTSTFRLNADGEIADYRIFMDPAPAFSDPAQ